MGCIYFSTATASDKNYGMSPLRGCKACFFFFFCFYVDVNKLITNQTNIFYLIAIDFVIILNTLRTTIVNQDGYSSSQCAQNNNSNALSKIYKPMSLLATMVEGD